VFWIIAYFILSKISLHKLFSVYLVKYTNDVEGGMMYQDSNPSVLIPVFTSEEATAELMFTVQ